jgi:hypothetical protein
MQNLELEKSGKEKRSMLSQHDWTELTKRCLKSEPYQVLLVGKNGFVCFKPLTENCKT